jgi:murein hydrolase activator
MRSRSMAFLALLIAGGASAQRAEMERVQKDLAQERTSLDRLSRKQASVLEELDKWEEQIAPLEDEARASRKTAQDASAHAAVAEASAAEAKRRLDATLDDLTPRLRARYRLSRSGAAAFLASSSSASDLVRRTHLLDLILQQDLGALRTAKEQTDELATRRAERDRERAEAETRAKTAEEKAAEARHRRVALSRLSEKILDERALHERTLKELEAQQVRLAELIEKSRVAGFSGHSVFAVSRGKLPYPTQGTVEVGFGRVENPKFHTVTFQKGLDIRAAAGAPVIAIAPGKVVHAGWFRGYGNLVIIDHGDGFHSLAAHLATATAVVGKDVAAKEEIGQVGETGSLKGPYLYFEIRHRGKPVDPVEWLGKAPAAPSNGDVRGGVGDE